jgi:hypothetical protein
MRREFEMRFAGDMTDLIIDGKKRATTRNTVHGYPGDVFKVRGIVPYMVVSLWYWPLGRVRDLLYSLEGFDSPEAFERFWRRHKHEFDPERGVYVHIFDEVDGDGFGYWPEPWKDYD